jgi:probable rRNA maturation factor
MKIEITNHQRIKKVNLKNVSFRIKKAARYLGLSSKKITFCLCDDNFIIKLNKKYFKKSTPTDVISFSLADELTDDYLGEVIVSVERAVIMAKELNVHWQEELLLYLVHGMLHLAGYKDGLIKDKKIMRQKEAEVLEFIAK